MDILVSGALGRMGKEIISCIEKDSELNFVCGFSADEGNINGIPVYNDTSKIKENFDIIIDFSHSHATLKILEFASEKHIPIVIATTGFNTEQEKIVQNYSKTIPIFKSANMSFDVNLMCKLVAEIAPLLTNCDIEISETHHRNKVDAPSGTALLLANSINDALRWQNEICV